MKRIIAFLIALLPLTNILACNNDEEPTIIKNEDQKPPVEIPSENETPDEEVSDNNINISTMNLTVNNTTLKVNLADNAATKALAERLKNGPITYKADDYGGFEKVGGLGFSLPSADTRITTQPGEIMLYTGNQLCIFFDSNTWSYTPIGKIEGMSKNQLKEAFGTGEVSISLEME